MPDRNTKPACSAKSEAGAPQPRLRSDGGHTDTHVAGRPLLRVEIIGKLRPGVYKWVCRCMEPPLAGFSSEPLLDACRKLQSLGAASNRLAGLFWPERTEPSLTTTVGAGLTVRETAQGPHFIRLAGMVGNGREWPEMAGNGLSHGKNPTI
jgi:hypothetical protein